MNGEAGLEADLAAVNGELAVGGAAARRARRLPRWWPARCRRGTAGSSRRRTAGSSRRWAGQGGRLAGRRRRAGAAGSRGLGQVQLAVSVRQARAKVGLEAAVRCQRADGIDKVKGRGHQLVWLLGQLRCEGGHQRAVGSLGGRSLCTGGLGGREVGLADGSKKRGDPGGCVHRGCAMEGAWPGKARRRGVHKPPAGMRRQARTGEVPAGAPAAARPPLRCCGRRPAPALASRVPPYWPTCDHKAPCHILRRGVALELVPIDCKTDSAGRGLGSITVACSPPRLFTAPACPCHVSQECN